MHTRSGSALVDLDAVAAEADTGRRVERSRFVTGKALAAVQSWAQVEAVRVQGVAVRCIGLAQVDLFVAVHSLPPAGANANIAVHAIDASVCIP